MNSDLSIISNHEALSLPNHHRWGTAGGGKEYLVVFLFQSYLDVWEDVQKVQNEKTRDYQNWQHPTYSRVRMNCHENSEKMKDKHVSGRPLILRNILQRNRSCKFEIRMISKWHVISLTFELARKLSICFHSIWAWHSGTALHGFELLSNTDRFSGVNMLDSVNQVLSTSQIFCRRHLLTKTAE